MTDDELFFSVFCIESVARELGIPGRDAYEMLMEGGLINGYVVPYIDALHIRT
jgi:hypothetical protein